MSDGKQERLALLRRQLERIEQRIDEIFKGTNNRERLIGSNAYIHELVGKRCVSGIIRIK